MTTTPMTKCECLNDCGDDPRLATDRVQPCHVLAESRRKAAIAAKQTEARLVLHKQYNTTSIEDLVEAQAAHIAQLQSTLAAQPPKVGDLRADVVSPMAGWLWETEASIAAKTKGVAS